MHPFIALINNFRTMTPDRVPENCKGLCTGLASNWCISILQNKEQEFLGILLLMSNPLYTMSLSSDNRSYLFSSAYTDFQREESYSSILNFTHSILDYQADSKAHNQGLTHIYNSKQFGQSPNEYILRYRMNFIWVGNAPEFELLLSKIEFAADQNEPQVLMLSSNHHTIAVTLSNNKVRVFDQNLGPYGYVHETDSIKDAVALVFSCLQFTNKNNDILIIEVRLATNQPQSLVDVKMKCIEMESIAKSLNNPRNINAATEEGETVLNTLVKGNHICAIKMLLAQENTAVNKEDGYSKATALILAIILNRADIARLLILHKNIDINKRTSRDLTAIGAAVSNKHYEILELLLSHENTDINEVSKIVGPFVITSFNMAIYEANLKMIKIFLSSNHAKKITFNTDTGKGMRLIHHAVQTKNPEVVALLASVSDINLEVQNNNGVTPIRLTNDYENGIDKYKIQLILNLAMAIAAAINPDLGGTTNLGKIKQVSYLANLLVTIAQKNDLSEIQDEVKKIKQTLLHRRAGPQFIAWFDFFKPKSANKKVREYLVSAEKSIEECINGR